MGVKIDVENDIDEVKRIGKTKPILLKLVKETRT